MKNNPSPFALFPGISLTLSLLLAPVLLQAAEVLRLDEENWDDYAPKGKEVDAIYGDFVLRNDRVVAVIGDPINWRHANMTVRNVGGAVIDFTRVDEPNDQLSAFYPAPRDWIGMNPPRNLRTVESRVEPDGTALLICRNEAGDGEPQVEVEYRLADKAPFLRVRTRIANPASEPIEISLRDDVRADVLFEKGSGDGGRLVWMENRWFPQVYGVLVEEEGMAVEIELGDARRPPWQIRYLRDGSETVTLEPNESIRLERLLFAARDLAALRATLTEHLETPRRPVMLAVTDTAGPVVEARVEMQVNGEPYAAGFTDESGRLETFLPPGAVEFRVESLGRTVQTKMVEAGSTTVEVAIEMDRPGFVAAEISDVNGGPIPCKVQFIGKGDTPTPHFFHQAGEHAVHNLYYSHDGRFRQPLGPGEYEVIISYGPEYDAIFAEIQVRRGEETPLTATLERVVDGRGWISAELHSHSSASGDNVASQRGRVLNLLAEHLEFAPCTEHNRIDTYQPHLEALGVEHLMATCPGIELTRSPLPLNHHNAFPVIHRPRTQHGGGPDTHADPIQQVKRLFYWDDAADKLMQANHPNIIQMFFDRELDGEGDEAYREILPYLDVIEVHPPHRILDMAVVENGRNTGGNRMHSWLLMLNQGMWLPGVVNTDAHYNFHGSGWLRNFIYSPEDDPAKLEITDLVTSLRQGRVVMSNGPFMEVSITAAQDGERAIPGDTIAALSGEADLHVRVQCANWLDIDRVQVLVNGRQVEELNFTRESDPDWFSDEVVKFDRTINLSLPGDAHIIVVAIGEQSTLGPVMGERRGRASPVAVSNPIFVDIDGNGFEFNGDTLGAPLPLVNREG